MPASLVGAVLFGTPCGKTPGTALAAVMCHSMVLRIVRRHAGMEFWKQPIDFSSSWSSSSTPEFSRASLKYMGNVGARGDLRPNLVLIYVSQLCRAR